MDLEIFVCLSFNLSSVLSLCYSGLMLIIKIWKYAQKESHLNFNAKVDNQNLEVRTERITPEL